MHLSWLLDQWSVSAGLCLMKPPPVSPPRWQQWVPLVPTRRKQNLSRNNCFTLWYKDINLSFVYMRAGFKSLTGREPCTEYRVKHDRDCAAAWLTGVAERALQSSHCGRAGSVGKHSPKSLLSSWQRENSCFRLVLLHEKVFWQINRSRGKPHWCDLHLIYLIIASLLWGSLSGTALPSAGSGIHLRIIRKMEMTDLPRNIHVMFKFSWVSLNSFCASKEKYETIKPFSRYFSTCH